MPISPGPKDGHILIVDDSPDNLLLIQTMLEGELRYQVSLAMDGPSALVQVEKMRLDLILLDVMMPGMDGYEVTRQIRSNQRLSYIPILLITADERSSVVKGLDVGADDFIRKPVDIDELMARVRSLLRLKRNIDEREQLALQREDFVSRLTHDLRTPLVAADRVLNLCCQQAFGEVPPEMDQVLKTLIQSNANLLQLVNTLLEVYRHESGRKAMEVVVCSLSNIVQEVVQQLQPLAEQKHLALQLELQTSGQSAVVLGDYLELRRLMTNLVGNAIKFTDQGNITVCLAPAAAQDLDELAQDREWVSVSITDTGAGIALEEQATIFERFRQGVHKHAGSGLGLYLSRLIAESHGGTIEVRSQPGQGSQFTVRLPLANED